MFVVSSYCAKLLSKHLVIRVHEICYKPPFFAGLTGTVDVSVCMVNEAGLSKFRSAVGELKWPGLSLCTR
jgi:hypothetical protein